MEDNRRQTGSASPPRVSRAAVGSKACPGVDIFVGGLWDDLPLENLGVVRGYAADYETQTGRNVLYVPNGRVDRVRTLSRSPAVKAVW